jgi:hypothetical protein
MPRDWITRAGYEHWLKADDLLKKLQIAIEVVQTDGILA